MMQGFPSRVLGLDYGDRRIGVALSDETGLTAGGLTTIVHRSRSQTVDMIATLCAQHRVEGVVLGLPLRLDGTEGVQCEKVRRFARFLEKRLSCPVILWDETLTTWEAQAVLRETHLSRARRKAMTDRVAASLMLQHYLARRPQTAP